MDGTGNHEGKWNKPDSERQILQPFLIWRIYFLKKDMKVKSRRGTLREEEGDQWDGRKERVMRGMNKIEVHFIYVWKCHNATH
jgi:hypothetical protein